MLTLHIPSQSGLLLTFSSVNQFSSAESEILAPKSGTQLSFFESDPVPRTEVYENRMRGWCYGEIHSYDDDGSSQACLSRAIADIRRGKLQGEKLNGRFVLLVWDEVRQELTVITDRMGAMHLYAARSGGVIKALGSDLYTVAEVASRRKLDWRALAGFFAVGFFPADRTYYDDVSLLLPASRYVFDHEGKLLTHELTWHWQHDVRHDRSYDETVEQYDALLKRAVTRRLDPGRIMLPISGGLDSRSLAAVMPKGPQNKTYSYGYWKQSPEIRIAKRIAKKRDFEFTAHVIDPYMLVRLDEISRVLHGAQDVTKARQMSVNDWVSERADAVLTGLWGDVWCDQMGLAQYASDRELPEKLTPAMVAYKKGAKQGREWLIENLVVPNADFVSDADDVYKWLADETTRSVEAFSHIEDPDFRVKAHKTATWGWRWSNASLRGFDPGGVARVPYYDVDLIDFFCTVPTEFVSNRRLQIDHLKRNARDLALIRWQAAESNLYLAPIGWWVSLPRRAIAKLWRTITQNPPIERNWEVQFLKEGGRVEMRHRLLEPGLKVHDYIRKEDTAILLRRFHMEPNLANGYTVAMLLTFATWLEL